MAASTLASDARPGSGAADRAATANAIQNAGRFMRLLTSIDSRGGWVDPVSRSGRAFDVSVTNPFPESLPRRHRFDTRPHEERAMLPAVTGKPKSESTVDGLRELILRMGALAEAILEKALVCVAQRDRALGMSVQADDLEIDRLDVAI